MVTPRDTITAEVTLPTLPSITVTGTNLQDRGFTLDLTVAQAEEMVTALTTALAQVAAL